MPNPESAQEVAEPRSRKVIAIVACVCATLIAITFGAFFVIASLNPIDAADKPFVEQAEELVRQHFDAPGQIKFKRKTYKITREQYESPEDSYLGREKYLAIKIYGEGLNGDEPFSFNSQHNCETGKLEFVRVNGKAN